MANRSNRRDPRVNIVRDVKVQTAKGLESFETKNISYRGIFIICEDPLPLRRITRIEMEVGSKRVAMLGMVAHRINVADAAERRIAPGMGIQIFSVGHQAREDWNNHVSELVDMDPVLVQAVRDHNLPRVKIHLATAEMLQTFTERDIPQGQIYYRTPEPLAENTEIILEILHPVSGQKFNMKGHVSKVVDGARRHRGMFLALEPLDEKLQSAFADFVASTPE